MTNDDKLALPTEAEIEEARVRMEDARVAADLARDAFAEAEQRYNDLVSMRGENTPLHAAVSDFFKRQDELAAQRHEQMAALAAAQVVMPVNAPSVLDASRQIAAKTKKRGPQVSAN